MPMRNTIVIKPSTLLTKPKKIVEKYKFIKNLGEGAYGVVYLAQGEVSLRYFAIKEIDVKKMDVFKKREAKNEAVIMEKFDHPNIIKCFDTFTTKDELCFVMEFVDGDSLGNLIKDK